MAAVGSSAAELRTTLQRIAVPSVILDRGGELTWMNDAAIAAFGDLTGRHYSALFAPEDRVYADEQFRRKLEGVPVTDYEADMTLRDGRRVRAEISSVPIPGGDVYNAVFGVLLSPLPKVAPADAPHLTPRQAEVLHLLARGSSTDQIAAMLHLSRETVRNYVRQLLRALGAHSRLEAVANARRDGLV
jgi:PAS domain S-box-containing protein